MLCVMGVDVGPSALKAAVYDGSGHEIAFCSLPSKAAYTLDTTHPEWVCWDPDIIWNSIKMAITNCVGQLGSEHELKAIAVTGMGMDGLPVDRDGNWLYPFISWHCTRTLPQYSMIVNQVGKERIFDLTGQHSTHIHSVYRMMWLRMNHPQIYEKTHRWLLIEDYINHKLCGSFVTDYSMASTTSLLDYRRHIWSEEMLSAARIDKAILPDLENSGRIIGAVLPEVSGDTGLPKDLPVVLGGHDYICAALLGSIPQSNMVMDMVGSWEMLLLSADNIVNTKRIYTSNIKIDCHVSPGEYCLVADFVSTHMVEWFNKTYRDNAVRPMIHEQQELSEFLALASASKDAGGVFFLPALCGAGSPNVDSRSRGAFVGLNELTDKSDLARAVMEGLNYQSLSAMRAMNSVIRRGEYEQIVAVGEVARQPVWMQNKADITGKQVQASGVDNVAIRGVAKLAMQAVNPDGFVANGLWGLGSALVTYEPNPRNRQRYLEGYEIYKCLQPALLEINHSIAARERR